MVRAALVASVAWTSPPVSRQSRKVSIVPNASSPRSAAARAPGDLVEQPGELGRGEVGVDHQASARADQGVVAGRAERAAALGGAPVLPHDRAVHRPAARPLPQHHGLALVGDADRRDLARAEPVSASASRQTASVSCQMVSGSCSTQPGARVVLLELALRCSRPARPPDRTGSRACWWCPGRSPGRDALGPRSASS